jgi:AcrR family transcriptional regulator
VTLPPANRRSGAGSADEPDVLSAKDTIIEVAISQLAAGGETAVRLATIADEAGVAIGLISYHFGGRDGLIHAAQRVRYQRRLRDEFSAFQNLLGAEATVTSLRDGLRQLTASGVASSDHAASRLDRMALLGSMHGRPDLVVDLGELQGELTDQLGELVQRAQQQGLVREDLDPRAIATFAQAYALGMVLADIDPRRPSDEDLLAVVLAALGAFFNETPPSP